ncbi:tRNA uridine(34) 5-carboxymethylaminomethyl modification radical SAM/GNAT enzyme Elp3 [Haloarcula onubensis]|uniref:tRNA carboxymethyluridine synthase n=1 Tax=Haloarcula onubensis TaxID=2950539 RepID=A0ABU2FSF7_9EURY|nr:tRNA uridine(34) 5-carboxymethylaminomethyl modification radical SAM/GNAT enzyme Elp3 [Halomicroarcula sp. S3CR25-11]MDS0283181.1 tRNA uridine(34) 5-carboxymethylaminomethyl modification radical SAM/GNAT enzyme Elp3 [Halomicroarcula sp. S3CR25-11]
MSTETEDPEETEAFQQVCAELVDRILAGDVERDDVESAKIDVCREYSAPKVPQNSELLDYAPQEHREVLEEVLQRKPVRTASGVSPIAIMTSPHRCPHGKCLYCPGGPDSEFSSAQSYTGHEPAAARGEQNDYDPYGQVTLRLNQLREIGHPVDKAELIVMGGTMTARSHDYQEWFVKRAIEAMNDFDPEADPNPKEGVSFAESPDEYEFSYLEDVIAENETAAVRNVATTFETKPDWCDPEQIDRMLRLGGTKVEVGVQTTFERINREMHRGHGVQASIDANRRLRDSAFKVGFHMMPGQPGMSKEMCLEDFRRLFSEERWKPDYLKIYPTLVVPGTVTYDWWKKNDFDPLDNQAAAELVAEIKDMIPRYTRLQRVQRDIPADFIEGGVWKSNLRQLAWKEMEKHGWTCDCIRCREAGHSDEVAENVDLDVMTYEACGGTEKFISFEDFESDVLVGFCRLRFPDDPVRRELQDAALVRELHVYGNSVGLGQSAGDDDHQHRGYGQRLLAKAEELARDAGFSKIAVISGIGVREYYREKLGYKQDGPYVSKRLR